MKNPLSPKQNPNPNHYESLEKLLFVIISRLDNLAIIISNQNKPTAEPPNPAKRNQQITTAVALVVYALTVLALILKGCGVLG